MSAVLPTTPLRQRRARSFEGLFEANRQVSKRRRQYPKRCVEDLLAWLTEDAKKVIDAGQHFLDAKTASDAAEFSAMRQKLLETKDELLKCSTVPQHIPKYVSVLDQFLGDSDLVVIDEDCNQAAQAHKEWFARLCSATRHTNANLHKLQSMLSDNKWLGNGAASVDTAASLTTAWAVLEDAIEAESHVLADTVALRTVHHCAQRAMSFADAFKDYLLRAKDDYHLLSNFESILHHATMFPELQTEREFLTHLQEVVGLPLCVEDMGYDDHGSYSVEVDSTNMTDFKALSRRAHKLSRHGLAIPMFVVKDFKILAEYAPHTGMEDLKALSETHEITEQFLRRLWNTIASVGAVFRRCLGRQHGAIRADNVFVDVVTENIILGPHAVLGSRDRDVADISALTQLVEDLRASHGLSFSPGSPLKCRVQCDTCPSLCLRSTTCPTGRHAFCEDCMPNLLSGQTDAIGVMKPAKCPMGCDTVWSDLDLLRVLPRDEADGVHKRRRLHFEVELRRTIRHEIEAEIEAEIAASQRAANESAIDELPQALINESLDLMVDKCRGCGAAFDSWDGCMALACPCGRHVCAYCLMLGTHDEIHLHIGTNTCAVRRQMFPQARFDFFHQGQSPHEEFAVSRKIRIVEEMHALFMRIPEAQRTPLARRLQRDVEDNGVDIAMVCDLDE